MTRVRGGTNGILAALDSGKLDPLDGDIPERPTMHSMSGSERRAREMRDYRRAKRLANRTPF